jgi:hypothetical protein
MNRNYLHPIKMCRARGHDSSYNELASLVISSEQLWLLEPEVDIVRLISFLRELCTRLSMVQSHAGSTFKPYSVYG